MNYLLTLLLIISFGGCEFKSATNTQMVGIATNVKEIKLSDGTKCAIIDSVYGSGISCDWGTK